MTSHKSKYLSAAVGALALIATAAGARTMHPQAPSGMQPATEQTQTHAPATTGSAVTEAARGGTPTLWLHGILGCAPITPGLDCGKIQSVLPE